MEALAAAEADMEVVVAVAELVTARAPLSVVRLVADGVEVEAAATEVVRHMEVVVAAAEWATAVDPADIRAFNLSEETFLESTSPR